MGPLLAISMLAGLLWGLSLKFKAWAEGMAATEDYGHLD